MKTTKTKIVGEDEQQRMDDDDSDNANVCWRQNDYDSVKSCGEQHVIMTKPKCVAQTGIWLPMGGKIKGR